MKIEDFHDVMLLESVAKTAMYAVANQNVDAWLPFLMHCLSLFVGEEGDEGNPVLSETHIQF